MRIPKPPRVRFEHPTAGWDRLVVVGADEWHRDSITIGWNWTGRIHFALRNRPCSHIDRQAGVIYIGIPQRFGSGVWGSRTVEVAPGINVEITRDALGEQILGIEILTRHWLTEPEGTR